MSQDESAETAPWHAAWIPNLGPAVVVLLISIPLSMGIAIASGIPPARGLITAIIGGLVIGSLTGSRLQVSGPSAGLAVMVLDLVNRHGLEALSVVVPLMGIFQAIAGLFKLGQLFRAVSPAVINGMLAGIGVLIFGAQFHVMVDDTPKGSGLENLLSIPEAIQKGVFPLDGSVHHQAAAIGLVTLIILVAMYALRNTRFKQVPAPLVAVVVATVATVALGLTIQRVDMPASIMEAVAFPNRGHLALLSDPSVILSALALTFVASAETLLCSSAVDGMHDGDRTDYNRELFAQGVGNFLCGMLGAPPTTGVITRSTANVEAGATGPQSAIMVGVGLLAFMVAFPSALGVIPKASLAAILVFIGFKLVRNRPHAELRRYGASELVIYVLTIGVIVSFNLLTGILVGIGLAVVKLLYSLGKGFHKFSVEVTEDFEHGQVHVHLRGAASFMRLPKLASALESLPTDHEVHLHVEELEYIDHACLDIITKWERQRIQARMPVRVEWDYLHHKYHAKNRLDSTPDEHAEHPEHKHRLLDFIHPEGVYLDEPYADKAEAIDTLGRHLVREFGLDVDGDALIDSIHSREQQSSTCLGGGLMIPHGVLRSRDDLHGVLAISSKGWDFETPDNEPVRCIVLLATPQESATQHLAVLAAFARLFGTKTDLRDRILAAKTPEEVVELLCSEDAAEINYDFARLSLTKSRALPRPMVGTGSRRGPTSS
ncbi:MAG: PTS sugar transporter subunit IIA [Planctomycetes bacterium]|nr:PTS sugar transporter subunit IIA [Planctomycetota bacterium]